MGSKKINGIQLEFLNAGSGELVVFVHDSASDYRTWHGQVEDFSQKFQVSGEAVISVGSPKKNRRSRRIENDYATFR